MDTELFVKEVTRRIDRLEDHMDKKLSSLDARLDSMINSTIENKVRIDALHNQIKLLWGIIIAEISGIIAYIFKLI